MSPRARHSFAASAALAVGLTVLVPSAVAQNYVRTVTTQFKGRGLRAFAADGSNLNSVLIGPSWNVNESFGAVVDLVIPEFDWGLFVSPEVSLGKTGATVTFGGTGELGLRVKPSYSGGALDFTYNANIQLVYPRYPKAGQPVTVSASFGSNGLSTIRTTTPTFGATFTGVAKLSGNASTDAWLFGANLHSGKIFDDFSVGGEQELGTFDFSSSTSLAALTRTLNQGVGLGNPTPIGVSVEVPKLESGATIVGSDGTLTTTAFGKFLSVDTTLLDWMLLFLPGKVGEVVGITQGDYDIPGTNYNVNWAIAKAAANLDVGFHGTYVLKPKPVVSLQVQNSAGTVIASGPAPLTFTMPADGARITPIVTCDFSMTSTLGIGTGGSVGFYPFSGGAKGDLGFDVGKDTSVDFQFDVARLEWVGKPTAGTKVAGGDPFDVPQQADRTQTLSAVGINPADLTSLPREIFFGTTPFVADVPAYSTDADKTYRTIEAVPEQGKTFLMNGRPRSWVKALLLREGREPLELNFGDINNEKIAMQIPREELVRGLHEIKLTVDTRNEQDVRVKATYTIPLQVYATNPIIDGQTNTRADLDVQTVTNRVNPNGGAQTFYVSARNIFRTTEVVLDDKYVLPSDIREDQDLTGRSVIGFTIPAALAKELGGADHVFRLRTPGTGSRADGTPYDPARSATSPLFFIADKPTLTGVEVPDEPTNKAPIGKVPVWVALKGTNFTRATSAILKNYGGADVALETSYGTPTEMRVKLTPEILKTAHQNGRLSPTVTLSTPVVQVPADAQNPARVSGGVSSPLTVGLAYPAPSITRLEPGRLTRGSLTGTVRVYGDNLFRRPSNLASPATAFRMGNREVTVSYPAGNDMIVPYVDVALVVGQITENGVRTLTASNRLTQSKPASVVTENGKPFIETIAKTTFRVGPGLNHDPMVVGAPFYNGDTKFTLNGANVPILGMGIDRAYLGLSYDFLKTVPGSSAKLVAVTPAPGGGTSNAINLVLQEGDPSTVQVKLGGLTFDRATNTWRQPLYVTYTGSRNVAGGARIVFRDLPSSVTLTNAAGTVDGMPYLSSGLQPRRQVTVTAVFRRGTAPIAFTPEVRFP